jgi:hypothetical protein
MVLWNNFGAVGVQSASEYSFSHDEGMSQLTLDGEPMQTLSRDTDCGKAFTLVGIRRVDSTSERTMICIRHDVRRKTL